MIDVDAIADDPDVVKLLEQVRSLLSSNQQLAAKVEETMAKSQQKNMQLNRDKSQGYQFTDKVEAKFIGGIHYHGHEPDDTNN